MILALASAAAGAGEQEIVPPRVPVPPEPLPAPGLLPDPESLHLVRVDPMYRQLAQQLGDASYVSRERAMRSLLDAGADIPQLCALLSDENLSPEQRYRLLTVLQQTIVNRPRGALGISMQAARRGPDTDGGIEVTALVPGLPAENVLMLRDLITHIDGRPVQTRDDLAVLIQSRRPGEVVTLKVQRPRRDGGGVRVRNEEGGYVYDALELELQLGSVDQLVDRESGLTAVSPIVLQRRLQQAQEAAERYRPRPRLLRLADGGTVAFSDAAGDVVRPDRPVDEHPAVMSVLMQRRLIAEGHLQLTEALRQDWRERLRSLVLQSEAPELDAAERIYLQRVALRLHELISQ